MAVLQGSGDRPGEQPFRQGNQFFYLTGVEMPRALLLVDGRTRRSTLFLPARDERRERMYGELLFPGAEAAKITGIEAVVPREEFALALQALTREGRTIYTPFRPEVLGSASASDVVALAATNARRTRGTGGRRARTAFVAEAAHDRARGLEVKEPRPDPRRHAHDEEPARDRGHPARRRASPGEPSWRPCATAEPGMYEYELEAVADYVFKQGRRARGPRTSRLVATGRNTSYRTTTASRALIKDGDLVQFDYAPDYKYYSSDVTRVFPANGRFTPGQREFYGIYLQLYSAIMTSMRPRHGASRGLADTVEKMDAVMASSPSPIRRSRTPPRGSSTATARRGTWRAWATWSAWRCTTSPLPYDDVEARHDLHDRAGDVDSRRAGVYAVGGCAARHGDRVENLSAFVPIDLDEVEKTCTRPAPAKPARK